ncbi:ATP synthase subunit b [Thiosulfatimonas sediminis]|uniref:ATP synthase subunit b n=1 Tax=Thiosulfatimonas sediminis TaxID=2675054 RepID=A0A6F8PY34_9GAMM|nr:F0F1 ATP synthase subunit delta [Thiosulfatimonas sediminis]BBP46904.1 ATP synthase subunit b [Thiosulfatimonas sediminis]
MEFSWTTFILEIINFVLLMWILKHFLYRPVLNALQKRRETVDNTLQEALDKSAQAEELKTQYQQRLQAWEKEKNQLRQDLQQDLDSMRSEQQQRLREELQAQQEKFEINQQQTQEQTQQHYQSVAHRQGAEFAAKLLRTLSGVETEERLFDALMEQLDALDSQQIKNLQKTCDSDSGQVDVCSAYPLSEKNRQALQTKLEQLCPQPLKIHYQQDPELISGVRIHLGVWSLRMNLLDELNRFMELNRDRLNHQ